MKMSVRILYSRNLVGCLMKNIFSYSCLLCVILSILIQGSECVDEIYLREYNDTVDYSPLLFRNFDEILKYFLREEHYNLPYVKEAISIFKAECTGFRVKPPISGRRKPFIVIEGIHRPTRRAVARRLATLLRGTMLQSPPKSLMNLKFSFEKGPLKRAFHALSLYATGFIARRVVSSYPVVLNGYWFDQASFSVARTFLNHSLPPRESNVYDWPKDLVHPDIIFFIVNERNLHVKYPAGGTRSPDDIILKMLQVCRRMRGVPVVELSTHFGYSYTINQMKNVIEKKFSHLFDFFFNDYM